MQVQFQQEKEDKGVIIDKIKMMLTPSTSTISPSSMLGIPYA
jgi:hypothetical protein